MANFKFNLGDKVKDRSSGFEGIINSRTEWINGCLRYGIQAKVGKDGKLPDAQGFDENDLLIVKAAVIAPTPVRRTAGPQSGEANLLRR